MSALLLLVKKMKYPPAPMTLGNMRANGVRTLAAWCLGRGCNHFRVLDVRAYTDDVPVPSFGPRLRCGRCGHLGADARPNWQERAPVSLFGASAPPTDASSSPRERLGDA